MTRRHALGGVLALAALSATTGCGPKQDSKVARGDLVEVGDPAYDALFKELSDAVALSQDLDGEGPLRKAVAGALSLGDGADRDATIKALTEQSKALKDKGVPISVALSPEPKIGGKVEWAEPIEKVLREGLKRADELAALQATLLALEPRRAEALEQADLKLRPAGIPIAKIREVKAELAAVEEVLQELALLASNESGRAARYTLSVARAVDLTAGSSAPPAQPPPQAPEKKVPSWAKARPGGRPAGGTGKPATPPPKKPKRDDFDP